MFFAIIEWIVRKLLPPRLACRIVRRIRRWQSPLQLRYSASMLGKQNNHPYLYLLKLFWPIPWYFPCKLPPPPREINAYRKHEYFDTHYADLFELHWVKLWTWHDTPQRSFFRLYEALCANDQHVIAGETRYFWRRGDKWKVEFLQDPRHFGCGDQDQFAVMASLAEDLAGAFNWRLGLGMLRNGERIERADFRTSAPFDPVTPPTWTKAATRLDERLVLSPNANPKWGGSSPEFEKRNIQTFSGSLRTV